MHSCRTRKRRKFISGIQVASAAAQATPYRVLPLLLRPLSLSPPLTRPLLLLLPLPPVLLRAAAAASAAV